MPAGMQPGARSAAAQRRHNLPTPATPFFGRDRDLAALTDLLQQASIRLTLYSPGPNDATYETGPRGGDTVAMIAC